MAIPQSKRLRNSDCYCEGERGLMLWSQELRRRVLLPLLRFLTAVGVKPDHVTLLSLFVGLAFVPAFFFSKLVALACLAGHVLLDGLDGPLARYQEIDSPRGSFTDTMCDQIVVTATTICLMLPAVGIIEIAAGGCYIFLYCVVVAFAMIRNAMEIPYRLLLRPRFLVYVWIGVECLHPLGWINYLIWVVNVFLAFKMLTGFLKIRQEI